MTSRNWIHVPQLDKTPGAPIRTSTAYKWHCQRRFLRLFKRVGGKLFLDLDLLYEMAETGKLR